MNLTKSMRLLVLGLFFSTPAWALFDAQVLTGKRQTTFKGSTQDVDHSGTEIKAAVHLDPIPLVPIGFGLSAAKISWDKNDDLGLQSIDGLELGLEVEAWLPLGVAGLVPYAKLGYTVGGAYVNQYQDVSGFAPKALYKPKGAYLAAGVRWEFLMRLGVMLEIEKASRTLEFDKFEDLGALPAGSLTGKDLDADSLSILLGVQAGL